MRQKQKVPRSAKYPDKGYRFIPLAIRFERPQLTFLQFSGKIAACFSDLRIKTCHVQPGRALLPCHEPL